MGRKGIDYFKLSKTPLGIVEVDSTALFDCNIKIVGLISLLTFFLNPSATIWLLYILDNLKYHITIKVRVSNKFNIKNHKQIKDKFRELPEQDPFGP